MLNNEQTNIFPARRLIVGVREAFCQVFLRVAVAHFCQVIMYSTEETPYASNVRIIWQPIGDRPSSRALGLSLRWDAYLSMKNKGYAKLKWHALKGRLQTLPRWFSQIYFFIYKTVPSEWSIHIHWYASIKGMVKFSWKGKACSGLPFFFF